MTDGRSWLFPLQQSASEISKLVTCVADMHGMPRQGTHHRGGRTIVMIIILTRRGDGHHAPPETEPNWRLSLPTDLVISEQEERSEGGGEGEREGRRRGLRTEGERETSSSHSSKFVPPGCLPVRRSRRTDGAPPLTAAGPSPSVRPPARSVSIWPISNMVRKQARPMSSDRMRR